MENIKRELAIWVQLITFIITWVVLILVSGNPLNISLETIKLFPEVVTIDLFLYLLFITWGWRLPFLQGWFVRLPDLQGTWQGTLRTTWQHPKIDKHASSIPVILVIKQSFTAISCVMYTKESISYSTTALLSEEEGSGIKKLSYVYTNTPELPARGRSPIHDGAAILRIISTPNRSLKGEYWTNRKTTGEMELTYQSRKLLESFPADLSPASYETT